MKLTQHNNNKAIKSGMTLLELTVVILVLLSLIAILFVGARAWKRGSDRAGCIMNIRNVQQATRGHQNMTNEPIVTEAMIYNTSGTAYLPTPECPGGGDYTFTAPATDDAALASGYLFLSCDYEADAAATPPIASSHVPENTDTW